MHACTCTHTHTHKTWKTDFKWNMWFLQMLIYFLMLTVWHLSWYVLPLKTPYYTIGEMPRHSRLGVNKIRAQFSLIRSYKFSLMKIKIIGVWTMGAEASRILLYINIKLLEKLQNFSVGGWQQQADNKPWSLLECLCLGIVTIIHCYYNMYTSFTIKEWQYKRSIASLWLEQQIEELLATMEATCRQNVGF